MNIIFKIVIASFSLLAFITPLRVKADETSNANIVFQKNVSAQRRLSVLRIQLPTPVVTQSQMTSDLEWEKNHPGNHLYRPRYAYSYTFVLEPVTFTPPGGSQLKPVQLATSEVIWRQKVQSLSPILPGQRASDAPISTNIEILDAAVEDNTLIVAYRQAASVYVCVVQHDAKGKNTEMPWQNRFVERGIDAIGFVVKSAQIGGVVKKGSLVVKIKHYVGADSVYYLTAKDINSMSWEKGDTTP